MPELPDIEVYRDALSSRIVGATLLAIDLRNPFLLRTAIPPVESVAHRGVRDVRRLGKRIVIALDGDDFLVIHLMIAGRLHWLRSGVKPPGRITLAVFDFDRGRLALTEAGTKRRASLHLVHGILALNALDPGGIDVLAASPAEFAARLTLENHTLKRALTDPRLFSGIGNAYSDEILHRARMSPLLQTRKLDAAAIACLHDAARAVLVEWTERLLRDAGEGFPAKVTAFRPEMAVHGRYGLPCPVCAAPVQRIVYAENESNYCARCQNNGIILADRALSRLLHKSFPRAIDDG